MYVQADLHSKQKKSMVMNSQITVKSLPNCKILDWSKLKPFLDDKINMTETIEFLLDTTSFSCSSNVFQSFLYMTY